ncbi:MAG: DUF502 domain-containing protein [Marinibacterium sp.]
MNTPFDPTPPPHRKPGRFQGLQSSFLTGLVVIVPMVMTVWLVKTVVGWFDGRVQPLIKPFLPDAIPESYIDNLFGVGVVVFLVFTVLVGWIAKGLIGRSLLRQAEDIVDRMPVVRSVYSGIKQISETVFVQSERSFDKAVMVEYPRRGIWAVGFISTIAKGEIADKAGNEGRLMSVFVPTTPNPTSGFLLYFPEEDIIELDMSVEEAAKLVISAGLVYPNGKDSPNPDQHENPQTRKRA